MDVEELKSRILELPKDGRERLLREIRVIDNESAEPKAQASRRHLLDNMMGSCPHCFYPSTCVSGRTRARNVISASTCKRSFTEYTGTVSYKGFAWTANLSTMP